MKPPRILAALAAAFLGLVPVGAGAQTISGGGGGSVPLTASCITQSVAQLCFDASNTLSLRNGASAQALRIYNTTDGTNSEWLELSWLGSVANVGPNTSGTGSFRALALNGNGIQFWTATTYGALGHRWDITSAGNLQATTDNAYDIGASGASRPRNVYAGGYYASGYTTQSGTTYTVGTTDSTVVLTAATTVTLTLPTAASFAGRVIRLKTTGGGSVISASSNVVPKAGGAASTAILAATAGTWAELQSDATNWIVISGT